MNVLVVFTFGKGVVVKQLENRDHINPTINANSN